MQSRSLAITLAAGAVLAATAATSPVATAKESPTKARKWPPVKKQSRRQIKRERIAATKARQATLQANKLINNP